MRVSVGAILASKTRVTAGKFPLVAVYSASTSLPRATRAYRIGILGAPEPSGLRSRDRRCGLN